MRTTARPQRHAPEPGSWLPLEAWLPGDSDDGVPGDAPQPRFQSRLPPEASDAAVCATEHLLCDVFRVDPAGEGFAQLHTDEGT
jgi:hypothetical protein